MSDINNNHLHTGFIRSLGGWNRFIKVFDDIFQTPEEKDNILIKNMLLIDEKIVMDIFIENNHDHVFKFISEKYKNEVDKIFCVDSEHDKKRLVRDCFIESMLLEYKENFNVFEAAKNPREDIDPLLEGITHINTYTKSSLYLGRCLSNLADISVRTIDGEFKSLEGYWYWKITGETDPRFKSLSGFNAKKEGSNIVKKGLAVITSDDLNFQESIKEAIRQKLKQHPELLSELIKSTLPIRHYYYHQGTKNIISYNVIDKSKYEWQTKEIERVREVCQKKMFEVGQIKNYPPILEELKTVNKIRFK